MSVQPSAQGELKTTRINRGYMAQQRLQMEIMSRGYVWQNTVTHESLLEAG